MRARFMEEAICQKEARLLASGALAVESGRHTERAVNSRYVVRDGNTESTIHWSDFTKPMNPERAQDFLRDVQTHLAANRAFEVRGWIGPMPVEFQTTSAWHAAFCETYFREHFVKSVLSDTNQDVDALGTLRIWHDPNTRPAQYEISSPDDAFVLIDPTGSNIAVVGTALAAEIVDAVFFLLNDRLSETNLFCLKASAFCSPNGRNSTLLIGTNVSHRFEGTLDSDHLLLSNEHVLWSETGLSNPAGGCYSKLETLQTITNRSEILDRFGTLLENAAISERTRVPEWSDPSRLRVARACFRLNELSNLSQQTHEVELPADIILLTNDSTGTIPSIARLDSWQLRYHYMMSLVPPFETHDTNLRVALGSSFLIDSLPREASSFAHRLGEKAESAGSRAWLVNTGLNDRVPETIQLIESGKLQKGSFQTHSIFGFEVPRFAYQSPTGPDEVERRYLNNQTKFSDPDAIEIFERGGMRTHELTGLTSRVAFPH